MSSAKPILFLLSSLAPEEGTVNNAEEAATGSTRWLIASTPWLVDSTPWLIGSTPPWVLPFSASLANWMPLSIEELRLMLELVSSCSLEMLGLLASFWLKLVLVVSWGGLGLRGCFAAPLLPPLLIEGTLAWDFREGRMGLQDKLELSFSGR